MIAVVSKRILLICKVRPAGISFTYERAIEDEEYVKWVFMLVEYYRDG